MEWMKRACGRKAADARDTYHTSAHILLCGPRAPAAPHIRGDGLTAAIDKAIFDGWWTDASRPVTLCAARECAQ